MFICRRFIQFVFFFIVLLPSVTGGWIAYSGSLKHIPNINECSTKQLPPAATTTSIGEESKTFVNDSFVRTSVEEHDPPYVQQASAPHERSIFTHESKNGHCGSTVYPMDLVVGYPLIQKALEIAVVTGTSLVIVGPTGTCKSVMARSVPLLFPDPPPTTRVVHVPATAAEDALTGSVDLDKSLETGRPVFQSGLLTRAHGAIVLLDDVNLMDVSTASVLFQALADGSVHVEREGMSVEYPCQPAVTVATYNDDYEELREHFIDRFAMQVSTATAGATASVMDRVKGVLNVEAYADFGSTFCRGGSGEVSPSPRWQQKILQQAAVDEKERRERITEAKKLFPNIQMSRPQLLYVCQQATAWDCEGQRAEFFASLAARAAAALAGRRIVQEDDLEVAVKLCIAPRGRLIVVDVDQEASESPQQQSPDTLPIPPPPDTREMPDQKEQREEDTTEMEEQPDPQDTTNEEEPELTTVPEEFMFGVDTTISVDPHLLVFQKRFMGRGKRAGKRSRSFNVERGRFVKAIFSTGQRRGRLAVGATLRAAAPHQVMRRKRKASVRPNDKRIVIITKDDFRIQQLKKKIGNLVIFVVDASGSMALNRMSAAKGYVSKVLMFCFANTCSSSTVA